jgi:hypothetical protein
MSKTLNTFVITHFNSTAFLMRKIEYRTKHVLDLVQEWLEN